MLAKSWADVRPDDARARAKAAFVGAKTVATRVGSDKVAKRPAACVSNKITLVSHR